MADPTSAAPDQAGVDLAAPAPAAPPPERLRLGPDKVSLIPVMFFLLGALPLAASRPWLTPLLLLPLACAVWVLRARVVAIPVGVEVCNGLRATRVAWTDVEGVDVPKRGPLQLLRRGARPLPMTALSRRDVPRLLAVAQPAGGQPTGGQPTGGQPAAGQPTGGQPAGSAAARDAGEGGRP